MNEGGDALLILRRELVRRVAECEDFRWRYENDVTQARGLMAEVRRMGKKSQGGGVRKLVTEVLPTTGTNIRDFPQEHRFSCMGHVCFEMWRIVPMCL